MPPKKKKRPHTDTSCRNLRLRESESVSTGTATGRDCPQTETFVETGTNGRGDGGKTETLAETGSSGQASTTEPSQQTASRSMDRRATPDVTTDASTLENGSGASSTPLTLEDIPRIVQEVLRQLHPAQQTSLVPSTVCLLGYLSVLSVVACNTLTEGPGGLLSSKGHSLGPGPAVPWCGPPGGVCPRNGLCMMNILLSQRTLCSCVLLWL